MCGIFGLYEPSLNISDRERLTEKLSKKMNHRGPDNFGLWSTDTGLSIAHQRLSILELNSKGHQPMMSQDDRWVICFNGEIYNFEALRAQLTDPEVDNHSDTRVLVEAFAEWGISKTLTKIRGMFAIALWDQQERALYLMRDRMGEKPLYYGRFKDRFFFTSELKAIYAHPEWQPTLDLNALNMYFKKSCVPYPQAIFKGVHQLPPGHTIKIQDFKSLGGTKPQPFWRLNDCFQAPLQQVSFTEARDQIEAKLLEVLSLQMKSDVPLGAFLSGGIDSSLIVALMQQISNTPIQTFTIGFSEAQHDESSHAKEVAKHLGTKHTELILSASAALDVVPKLCDIYDEPFADSSQIPTYLVSKMTRNSVTVALSGDGGDELFSGYTRYLWLEKIWKLSQKMPPWMKSFSHSGIQSLSESNWNQLNSYLNWIIPQRYKQNDLGQKLYKLDRILSNENYLAMYESVTNFWDQGSLLDPTIHAAPPHSPTNSDQRDMVEYIMAIDSLNFLPNDILTKVDRSSMAVSLEGRMPFLDHELQELAWSLPQKYKIQNGISKYLTRSILYRYVPQQMIERPKQGFAIPIDHWLRTDLKPWAEDLLSESMLKKHPWLNPRPLRQRWEEHKIGERNWGICLWNFLMFQSWYLRWVQS